MTEQEKYLQKANKQLEMENAKLQEDNQFLKELIKIQKTLTGGAKFTKTSVETVAKTLKAKANANGDTKALAKLLENFYGYIAMSDEITWESVMEQAQPVVADLLNLVNKYFPDILPEGVLRHFGYDARPEGDLGLDALYQERAGASVSNRSLLANAFADVAQNDIEKQKIQEYKEQVDIIDAEERKFH